MKKILNIFYFCSFFLYFSLSTMLYAGINEGLVAYYPFNGNANDESNNGNNGIVNGAVLVEDRLGNPKGSYSLDGKDDYIDLGTDNSLNLRDSFSVSIWFNVDDLENDVNIFSRGGFAFDDQLFCQARLTVGYSDIHCRFSADGSVGTEINSEKITWEAERWYNFVITKSLSEKMIKYYLNGEEVKKANFTGTLHSSIKPFLIGWNQNDHVNKFFDGVIDDIRIYKRSLSEFEI